MEDAGSRKAWKDRAGMLEGTGKETGDWEGLRDTGSRGAVSGWEKPSLDLDNGCVMSGDRTIR